MIIMNLKKEDDQVNIALRRHPTIHRIEVEPNQGATHEQK